MILKAYCWYDKVDKVYMADSFVLSRSERAVCRGFINEFSRDKKMNPAEFDLIHVGSFDDEKGVFTALKEPSVVDVNQVYAEQPNTNGSVADE